MTLDQAPLHLQHFVAGAWVPGTGSRELVSHDPSSPTRTVAVGAEASARDVAIATEGVASAWSRWASYPLSQRAALMLTVAEQIGAEIDTLGMLVCSEVGKPIEEGRAEAVRAAEIFRFFAGDMARPVGGLYASADAFETVETTRRPMGVFGIITPFNFPLALPAWKLAAALVNGNGVVWKPSEAAAAISQRLLTILLASGIPPEVVALVQGGREAGDALTEQTDIAGISFTGSTAVGRLLIARGGSRALPVQAEMGGSNPVVVLSDADLDLAAREIVSGAFSSCGQRCTATRRVVCDAPVHADLLERIETEMAVWTVGNPTRHDVRVGPVISEAARVTIEAAVTSAEKEGARLVAESSLHPSATGGGHFVRPRLLEVRDPNSILWTAEVFGPVTALLEVEGEDAAIRAAQHRDFGLSAAVFTDSLSAARRVGAALDVGVLHINSATTGASPHVPFGGVKGSGFGPMEQGEAAHEFYTTRRTTYVRSVR
jgi:acyl-CoA reductase-like NAD-dependent aldehyde dehydrogenase